MHDCVIDSGEGRVVSVGARSWCRSFRSAADLLAVSERVVDVEINHLFVTFYAPDREADAVDSDNFAMRGFGNEAEGESVCVWNGGDCALRLHPTLIITATMDGAKPMYDWVKGRTDYRGFIDAAHASAKAKAQLRAELKAAELRRLNRAPEAAAVQAAPVVLATSYKASESCVLRYVPAIGAGCASVCVHTCVPSCIQSSACGPSPDLREGMCVQARG